MGDSQSGVGRIAYGSLPRYRSPRQHSTACRAFACLTAILAAWSMLSIGCVETASQARSAYSQPATNDERVPAQYSIKEHEHQSRMAVTSRSGSVGSATPFQSDPRHPLSVCPQTQQSNRWPVIAESYRDSPLLLAQYPESVISKTRRSPISRPSSQWLLIPASVTFTHLVQAFVIITPFTPMYRSADTSKFREPTCAVRANVHQCSSEQGYWRCTSIASNDPRSTVQHTRGESSAMQIVCVLGPSNKSHGTTREGTGRLVRPSSRLSRVLLGTCQSLHQVHHHGSTLMALVTSTDTGADETELTPRVSMEVLLVRKALRRTI